MSEVLSRCLFVIGRQRSGTTVTRKSLCSHPRIVDLGEIMHPQYREGFLHELSMRAGSDATCLQPRYWFPVLVSTIEKLAGAHPADTRFLVDIKYNMALSFGVNFIESELRANFFGELEQTNASVLHIIRRAKVELIVSEQVALKTQKWQLDLDDERASTKIWLNPYTIGMRIREEEAQDEYVRKQLARNPRRLEVCYEDIFGGPSFRSDVLKSVVRFVGLDDDFEPTVMLQKQGRPMYETIENFKQVETAVNALIERRCISEWHRLVSE